jgi:hypothetical protein
MHGLRHRRAVIPHRCCNGYRRSSLPHGIESRAENAAHAANLMTQNAAFPSEKLLSRIGISQALEIILRKEKGDEIPGFDSTQPGKRLALLLHACRHCGEMIPHRRSEIIKGAVRLNSS